MTATHTCAAARRHPHGRRQVGGLLIEVSLVMLLVGILTVATFEVHSAMRKRQQTADARSLLHSIDAAIRAFVIRERRLPCPSAGGSGVEQLADTVAMGLPAVRCVTLSAEVPFLSLGLEMPLLRADRTLKYGVSPALSVSIPSRLEELLGHAKSSSEAVGSMRDPYVAGRDAHPLFGACHEVALNPAYALMWMPRPGTAGVPAVPDLCFRESADQSMGLLAVSGQEFLGWLLANLKQ